MHDGEVREQITSEGVLRVGRTTGWNFFKFGMGK